MARSLAPLAHDDAVRGILVMNAVVAIAALAVGDSLGMLLWPYWLQSVVIGYYAVRRIQKLQRFVTDGLKINDAAVLPTPQTQRQVWTFFVLHYGFFHVGYLVFLLALSGGAVGDTGSAAGAAAAAASDDPWAPLWFAATAIGFFVSHGQSHREHVVADLRGTPNIGTLMFMPYIRIVPMHLTIIFGAMLGGGAGLLLFAALKTAADVAMHKVEHRVLQGGAARPS